MTWLDRNLPYHTNFLRFRTERTFGGQFAGAADIDPEFDDPQAISPANKRVRDSCIALLEQKLGDSELVAKMTPPHPVMSARPVRIDPDYSVLDAIQRDNVSLVTDNIRRFTPGRRRDEQRHRVRGGRRRLRHRVPRHRLPVPDDGGPVAAARPSTSSGRTAALAPTWGR